MNRTLSNVLLFTAGAIVGSAVTWKIFKSRYEIVDVDFDEDTDEAEDEPEDEGEVDADVEAEVKTTLNNKPPLKEYVQMVNKLAYADAEAADTEEDDDVYEPYIIRPEEYGEIHAYDLSTETVSAYW